MNKLILMGRLTRDPEVRYGGSDGQTTIAKFSLAVDRKFKRQGDSVTADFFDCAAFGKTAEVVERYIKKGTKILVSGRVQNNNYTNKDGQKVYSVQVVVEELEFAESKQTSDNSHPSPVNDQAPLPNSRFNSRIEDEFMNIPDGVDDEELPFN